MATTATRHEVSSMSGWHLPTHAALADGTLVHVRPAMARDRQAMASLLADVGPEATESRFLTELKESGYTPADYLAFPDGWNHLGLVLEASPSGSIAMEIVGMAQCVRVIPDGDVAEVAVVVAAGWQRRGVGSLLLHTLATWAWRSGVRRWRALMYPNNVGARRVLEGVVDERARRLRSEGVLEIIYELPPVRPAPRPRDPYETNRRRRREHISAVRPRRRPGSRGSSHH